MGGKGDLSSANALDCSGFASSLMRKVGQNLDASTGQRVSQTPSGSAADLVAGVRANGGAMAVQDLLRNPRPGCLIGLNTGAPHGAGRPLGIDHVGVTVVRDGKPMIAEFTPGRDGKGGLHVTPLNEWVNRYEKKGAGIYVAGGPEAMCNKQALAQVMQPEQPKAAQAPAPTPAQQVADASVGMSAGR
jgi:cell wall-associated NlpC family hydrolase